MDTVSPHPHSFSSGQWPFAEPENVAAFTSREVLSEGRPVLLVFHDHDGEWQFLHGPVGESDIPQVICLGCAYERDRTVGELAQMPSGTMASRAALGEVWEIEPYESSEDDG